MGVVIPSYVLIASSQQTCKAFHPDCFFSLYATILTTRGEKTNKQSVFTVGSMNVHATGLPRVQFHIECK